MKSQENLRYYIEKKVIVSCVIGCYHEHGSCCDPIEINFVVPVLSSSRVCHENEELILTVPPTLISRAVILNYIAVTGDTYDLGLEPAKRAISRFGKCQGVVSGKEQVDFSQYDWYFTVEVTKFNII